CGGYRNGKCEVNPDQDCAWLLIYDRLKARGKLANVEKVHDAKSNRTAGKPRTFVWERK
ncbi:MAG TPA: methylenetetrahydrofolate reductase C-terminal domain-containing protein, partial [Planctomycetota bacterium]|nr:methylenetetrahydrofolate reductase C-terminal domain-containing protein [Planctomycetota bacterium]